MTRALLFLLLAACVPSTGTELDPASVRVVDGDTIEVDGQSFRLVGYDTPETYRAQCPAELAAGQAATAAMHDIIASGQRLELHVQPERDRYGRGLGTLTVEGTDVARVLVAAGHARPYDGGRRQPWC